jgi:hypothetical protein
MRARRLCAHPSSSKTPKSLHIHDRPANTTANIQSCVSGSALLPRGVEAVHHFQVLGHDFVVYDLLELVGPL